MRNSSDSSNSYSSDNSARQDGGSNRRSRSRSKRRFGRNQNFGLPFGMPPQLAQMMAMMMALNGGGGFAVPGTQALNIHMQLMSWMLELWLDYLEAVHDVMRRAAERLQDLGFSAEGLMGGSLWSTESEDDGDDLDEW